ncbi:hypothetical protein [Roseovarius sp. SYSU LYC5161]|uniref:hypothetical protein n=1 Tax=Roseovarius halophilus (ex Wu et al. 2025) TaxID=3376060 RepID=UPI00399AD182
MPEPDVQCLPRDERMAAVRAAMQNAGDSTHFVPVETGYLEAPVIELDHRVLVYRADNGRVLSELEQEARARATPLEHLKADAETPQMQSVLHDLLVEKSRDPRGPVYSELERYGRQTDPLLIGEDGIVLNGNRRLAAMRDLMARDSAGYSQFAHVRAAVLPPGLSADEIEFIEAALQMAPDLKLDYGWINRRLKLRQHLADMGRDRVIDAYRFPGAAAIDNELEELALAEEYLAWSEQPRRFDLVADQEQAFAALRLHLEMLDEALANTKLPAVWRRIGFAMIKARPELDRNILHYFPFTDPVPPAMRNWVPRSMAEDHGLVERQAPGENKRLDVSGVDRLMPLLDDPRTARTTAAASMSLIEKLKGSQDRLIGFARLVSLLQNASQTLDQIDVEDLTDEQMRRLRAKLASLQEYLSRPD